jgi:hypothetical protein
VSLQLNDHFVAGDSFGVLCSKEIRKFAHLLGIASPSPSLRAGNFQHVLQEGVRGPSTEGAEHGSSIRTVFAFARSAVFLGFHQVDDRFEVLDDLLGILRNSQLGANLREKTLPSVGAQ